MSVTKKPDGAFAAIVVGKKGHIPRIVVVKNNNHMWSLPGGGISQNECPIMAVARKTREEIGLKIPADSFVSIGYLKGKKSPFDNLYLYGYRYHKDLDDTNFKIGTTKKIVDVTVEDMDSLITRKNVYRSTIAMTMVAAMWCNHGHPSTGFDMVCDSIAPPFENRSLACLWSLNFGAP